jgi:TolB-like protein/DNA-binding SARP family transcriptional activator
MRQQSGVWSGARGRAVNNVTKFTHKTGTRSAPIAKREVRIHLLGRMRAIGPAGENILPRAKKTQAVLAYLILMQGEGSLRTRVAGIIWDRSGEAQARESLRHALNELNRPGYWELEKDHDTVRLDVSGYWIDAFEIPEHSDLLLEGLYGISPAFDQWLVAERTRLEQFWQSRLERELNELSVEGAAPELRAAAARKLLNVVPTHEAAVRSLMTAFIDLDDHGQAIREYERFQRNVNTSLGVTPSEKTAALYEAIRLASRARAARTAKYAEQKVEHLQDFSVAGTHAGMRDTSGASTAFYLKPSIAVLPLRNLSGELDDDHVSEGLVEDLVEALARIPYLFVVSRLSAASFRTLDRTPVGIGEALGVRYVLSGSIRIIANQLRLIVQLTDAVSGAALWISRIDERFSDLLEVQSHLAEKIVRSVAPHVRSAELKRVKIKHPAHQGAYDLFLRAQESMHSPLRAMFESSEQLLEEAIAREPDYAAALAWLAHWHVMRVGQGWSPDEAHDAEQADQYARRAADCDPTEPMAFAVQGHVAAYFRKDFELALAFFEQALQVNPNASRAWLWSAYTHAWIGNGSQAVQNVIRAMALSPYDPLVCAYSGGASLAYLADGQYARAVEFAMRCIRENRGYTTAYKALVLSLVLSGRETEARAPANQLRLLEPTFTVEQFRRRSPAYAGTLGERYCEAFERAGIPLRS